MQIKAVENQSIWNNFVFFYAPTALFQSWQWSQVQEKTGSKIWRFGIYNRTHLMGVFLAIKVIAKRGTFLHVRHGPIIARQSKVVWTTCLDYLTRLAKQEGAWFVRISPQLPPDQAFFLQSLGLRPSPIHAMDGEFCWVLDLGKSEEELLSGMRKTTRYEIKQAQKLGVQVTSSTTLRDLEEFLGLYQTTAARHGFVWHRGISEELEIFAKKDQALVYLAKYQSQVLAGALVLFYGNQAIYHHGASIPSKIPASYLVQWEAIKEAKRRGMLIYNFWGIAPQNSARHPWQGHSLFKRGFGGREVSYLHAHDLPTHPGYWLSWLVETLRRIRKGY